MVAASGGSTNHRQFKAAFGAWTLALLTACPCFVELVVFSTVASSPTSAGRPLTGGVTEKGGVGLAKTSGVRAPSVIASTASSELAGTMAGGVVADRKLPPAVVAKLPPKETTLPDEGYPLLDARLPLPPKETDAAGMMASIPGLLVRLPWHCASQTAEDG